MDLSSRWAASLGLLAALACGGRTDLSAWEGGGSSSSGGSGDGDGDGDVSSGGTAGSGGAKGSGGRASGGAPAGGAGSIDCSPGSYLDVEAAECLPWQDCEPGSFESSSPDAASDRGCEPCPSGSFSNEVNQEECTPWRECNFGSSLWEPGTPTSDIECVDPELFPPVDFDDSVTAAGMVATERGLHLGLNVRGESYPKVLHMAADGTSYTVWEVPYDTGAIITDLTAIGDDVYVAALTSTDAGDIALREVGIMRLSEDGSEHAYLAIAPFNEWILNVLVAAHGDQLIVARQVLPVTCDADCVPGVESHLVLSRYDGDFSIIDETRHYDYFNFASLGELEVVGDRIYVSGELTGSSGVHVFDANLDVLMKYDEAAVGGNIGHLLAMRSDDTVSAVASYADPLNKTLSSVDGVTAQIVAPLPNAGSDMYEAMVAVEPELYLVGRDWTREENLFARVDDTGTLVERRVDEQAHSHFSEVVRTPSGLPFVGGVGSDGVRYVGLIRPWDAP